MLKTTATNLPVLMHCIGSRLMPPALPTISDDTSDRDEGNAAHWLSQQLFNGVDVPVNSKAYNGFVVTQEMFDHVNEYLSELDAGEMEVDTSWSGTGFGVFGRCDHRKWRPETGTLVIEDFKYGHRIVEPKMNWTLISHAIGTISRLQIQPEYIKFIIHQPRPYHPDGTTRSWNIGYDDLMKMMYQVIDRLSEPTDELSTNPFCGSCDANAICPAARKAGYNAVDVADIALPDDMTPEQIGRELDLLERAYETIKNRRDSVHELATYKVTNGAVIENRMLDKRYAHKKWKPHVTPEMLQMLSGVDVSKAGLVTPAEAIRRHIPKEMVDSLVDRPFIGSKLIKVDPDVQARKLLGK